MKGRKDGDMPLAKFSEIYPTLAGGIDTTRSRRWLSILPSSSLAHIIANLQRFRDWFDCTSYLSPLHFTADISNPKPPFFF